MTDAEFKAQEERIRKYAESQWGSFRKFIARNPLTGFWLGFVAGTVALYVFAEIMRTVLG